MPDTLDVQPIILAAGKGTRMNSVLPKVLVELNGKPLIQHLLDNLKSITFGYTPVIVVGYKSELVQSYLGPDFIYAFQEGQFGTGHAVAAASNKVDAEQVVVLYGDMPFITGSSLTRLVELHQAAQSKFSMFTATVPHYEREFSPLLGFGRILRDAQGDLVKIKEFVDASEEERGIREVNPGIYLFQTAWLKDNLGRISQNKHGEYYLTDLVEIAIKNGLKITTAQIEPREVFGVNTPEQLAQAGEMM